MNDREGPSIDLIDVHKSYEEGDRTHEVLTGASVTIPAGQRVAILGPSGSGKSTLLNLMSGIDLPDSGTVRVGDTDLGRLSERDRTLFRRDHIGFVFQFFNLLPTLTVIENLLLSHDFVSAKDKHWKSNGSLTAYAATTQADFSIVPRNYNAGLVAVTDESCTTCHDPHGSNYDRLLVTKPPTLCQRCHNHARHRSRPYDSSNLPSATQAYYRGCVNCHQNLHGSNHPSGRFFLR